MKKNSPVPTVVAETRSTQMKKNRPVSMVVAETNAKEVEMKKSSTVTISMVESNTKENSSTDLNRGENCSFINTKIFSFNTLYISFL